MAIVGQVLTVPEVGMTRYNDNDPNIEYMGFSSYQDGEACDGSYHGGGQAPINSIKFNFTKTKLTLIAYNSPHSSTSVNVIIDGVTYPQYQCHGDLKFKIVAFTVSGLADTEHSVVITSDVIGFNIDAIDIEDSGILKPYNPNIGPVTPPTPTGNTLLRVTMIDSSEREYRLSSAEVDGFVNWYNIHKSTDAMSYALNDIVDSSKEYLVFDKIISFKVMTLTK